MTRKAIALLAALVFTFTSVHANAAEIVALFLKANGADIKGESTVTSLGRADAIECIAYEQSGSTAREAATGMATGRRTYDGIKITKRIDKSSPLLWKALAENQVIEGTFKFFRPNPKGDGTTEQFYTVAIQKGRIASIKQILPSTLEPQSASRPPMEEITFVFQTITWTYTNGGITATDGVAAQR